LAGLKKKMIDFEKQLGDKKKGLTAFKTDKLFEQKKVGDENRVEEVGKIRIKSH